MKKILSLIGGLLMGVNAAHAAGPKVGDSAPDFTAASSSGRQVHLKDEIGKRPIVLYFYPKDDTPGCTKEACSLRDDWSAFRKLDAIVYGISYDSVKSHQEFVKKYQLPFELLSDQNKSIAPLYGADGMLFAKRMTFVIDKAGKIVWINPAVSPASHSAELQKVLAGLN
jgi:thioredoxin-dependent peroxiredoxin